MAKKWISWYLTSAHTLLIILIKKWISWYLTSAYTGIESYNYYKEKTKEHKSMWHFAWTTFICVTLSFTTAIFFIPIITFDHKINLCPSFLIIQCILSSMFKINLYLFFLQRIHNTFQFSIHAIHSWLINIQFWKFRITNPSSVFCHYIWQSIDSNATKAVKYVSELWSNLGAISI